MGSQTAEQIQRQLLYIRGFFFLNLYFVVSAIVGRGGEWIDVRPQIMVEVMGWFQWMPFPEAEILLMAATLVLHLLTILFFEKQWIRIACVLVSYIFYGRFNNYDHIDHNYYFILYPLLFSALLKDITPANVALTARFCLVSVFVPFTLAGLNKICYGIIFLVTNSHTGAFSSIYAFHRIIAKETLLLPEASELALWMLKHPLISYIMYLGAIALQVLSGVIAWSERFLIPLAFLFCLFQLATWFLMTIYFQEAMLTILYAAVLYSSAAPKPRLSLKKWGLVF